MCTVLSRGLRTPGAFLVSIYFFWHFTFMYYVALHIKCVSIFHIPIIIIIITLKTSNLGLFTSPTNVKILFF